MEEDKVAELLLTAGFRDARQQRHEQGICVLATV
jgi:hypothetical protein